METKCNNHGWDMKSSFVLANCADGCEIKKQMIEEYQKKSYPIPDWMCGKCGFTKDNCHCNLIKE